MKERKVPINYPVYKSISSAIGKDIYVWMIYRNSFIKEGYTVFIPRDKLIALFNSVDDSEKSNKKNKSYSTIIRNIRKIKEKNWTDLNVTIDEDGCGIILCKSPVPVIAGIKG